MNIEQFLQIEDARKNAYQLLAGYYIPPEETQIEKLPALVSALGEISPDAATLITQAQGAEHDIEQLTIDFSQLFMGPFKVLAAPYGSVYLETGRQVMGESTVNAVTHYENAGLEISNDFKDAPDHISAELEFMCYLIRQVITVLENMDMEKASTYLKKQKAFLENHLGDWIEKFVQAVEENATTDFYKYIAKATLLFVQQDLDALESKNIPVST